MIDFNANYTMTIDGAPGTTARTLKVVNPATGEAFASCPSAGAAELNSAVLAAKRALHPWRTRLHAERQAVLRAISEAINANAAQLAGLFTLEQGRPTDLAIQEIFGAAYWIKEVAKQTLPIEITEDTPKRRIEVHREPLGVVCGIVPWNFPVLLAAWKIAPALLAGNTLVLKPSPFTPLCTLKIGELVRDIVPPGVFNIITGGDELGPMMTSHSGFAKISFTGSSATGKRVMVSAAQDLKRVTLELGGNDAAIIMPDVDVDAIAPEIFNGAFSNTAQICVATKRLYAHEAIYDHLRDKLHELALEAKVGDGGEQGIAFGPIQNAAQFNRVQSLLEDARKTGLKLLHGADVPKGKGYFIPLTIVDNPPEESRVVKEEAFGPILPMMKFTDVDEVIGRANDSEYGLAGSVWSNDLDKALEIAHRLDTGTVWINQNLQSTPRTPFAGHKHSGFGVENGLTGLLEFTQIKTIFIPKQV
jgi:acyl-CoA reductase-like NAD-dependent aldehyde dehydrogenase